MFKYMVYKAGGNAPSKQHEFYEQACDEAKRLAEKHPYCNFMVVEIKTTFKGEVVVSEVKND